MRGCPSAKWPESSWPKRRVREIEEQKDAKIHLLRASDKGRGGGGGRRRRRKKKEKRKEKKMMQG